MLRDNWKNKIDNVDIISANDINGIAEAVIDLEAATGDIEQAVDMIEQIQNQLIGEGGNG